MKITLIGTDGRHWDLLGGNIRLSTGGIRGLMSPVYETSQRVSAVLDGQQPTRWRLKPRDVFLPLNIKGLDPWLIFDFLTSTDPTRGQANGYGLSGLGYCTLRVTGGRDGGTRELALRFVDDGGYSLRVDPEVHLDAIGVTLIADDPWWYGPEVVTNYSMSDTALAQFFGESGFGPPFNIVAPSGVNSVYVQNHGDVDAWPTFELEGPLTSATVWLQYQGEAYATSLFYTLGDGETATIETRPDRQIALRGDGVNLNRWIGAEFAPVPRVNDVGSVYLSTEITGTGRVRARFRPAYKKAL